MTKFLVIVVAVTLTALVSTSVALGIVADSRLSVSSNAPGYHGRVRSNQWPVCRRHREVVLFKVRSGHDLNVGHDRTTRRGHWLIPAPSKVSAGDRVYAKVRPKTLRTQGTGFVCIGDRSRTMTAP